MIKADTSISTIAQQLRLRNDQWEIDTEKEAAEAAMSTVYVLINGGTFSAAAEFCAIARSRNRAIFIGQEAGGGYYGNSSLGAPLLTLPNSKIRVSIPLGRYELAVDQRVPVGHGVIPDYKTVYYIKDVLEGKDKELELCLKIIGERKN